MRSIQNLLNLKRLALKNVTSKSYDQYVEKCYRHYSKTYFTPLHEAKILLPIEEVVLIFLEDEMEECTAEEIDDIKKELDTAQNPVFSDSIDHEDPAVDDEAWIAQQNALLKEKETTKIMAETAKSVEKMTAQLKSSLDELKALDKKDS